MTIQKTARFKLRPESVEACVAAIAEFVGHVGRNAPGTLQYTAWQQADDPASFVHFMAFRDADAERRHASSEAVKRFTGILYPNTLDGVEFTDYNVVEPT